MPLTEMKKDLQRLIDFVKSGGSSFDEITEALVLMTAKSIKNKYAILRQSNWNKEVAKCLVESFPNVQVVNETKTTFNTPTLFELIKMKIAKPNITVEEIIEPIKDTCIIIKRDAGFDEFNELMKIGNDLAGSKKSRMQEIQVISNKRIRKSKMTVEDEIENNFKELIKYALENAGFDTNNSISILGNKYVFFYVSKIFPINSKQIIEVLQSTIFQNKQIKNIIKEWKKEFSKKIESNDILSDLPAKIDDRHFYVNLTEQDLIKAGNLIDLSLFDSKYEYVRNNNLYKHHDVFLKNNKIELFHGKVSKNSVTLYAEFRPTFEQFIEQIVENLETIEYQLFQNVK